MARAFCPRLLDSKTSKEQESPSVEALNDLIAFAPRWTQADDEAVDEKIRANAPAGDRLAIRGNGRHRVQSVPIANLGHTVSKQVVAQIDGLAIEPEQSIAIGTEIGHEGAADHLAVYVTIRNDLLW